MPRAASTFALQAKGSSDPPTQYPISPWPTSCGGVGFFIFWIVVQRPFYLLVSLLLDCRAAAEWSECLWFCLCSVGGGGDGDTLCYLEPASGALTSVVLSGLRLRFLVAIASARDAGGLRCGGAGAAAVDLGRSPDFVVCVILANAQLKSSHRHIQIHSQYMISMCWYRC